MGYGKHSCLHYEETSLLARSSDCMCAGDGRRQLPVSKAGFLWQAERQSNTLLCGVGQVPHTFQSSLPENGRRRCSSNLILAPANA